VVWERILKGVGRKRAWRTVWIEADDDFVNILRRGWRRMYLMMVLSVKEA